MKILKRQQNSDFKFGDKVKVIGSKPVIKGTIEGGFPSEFGGVDQIYIVDDLGQIIRDKRIDVNYWFDYELKKIK